MSGSDPFVTPASFLITNMKRMRGFSSGEATQHGAQMQRCLVEPVTIKAATFQWNV